VLIIILFIVLLIISFSLLEHLHHWLINDPDSKLDPADTKARDKMEAKFTEWMDKTLSTRRSKLNRSKKQAASKLKGFVVDDDDVGSMGNTFLDYDSYYFRILIFALLLSILGF